MKKKLSLFIVAFGFLAIELATMGTASASRSAWRNTGEITPNGSTAYTCDNDGNECNTGMWFPLKKR